MYSDFNFERLEPGDRVRDRLDKPTADFPRPPGEGERSAHPLFLRLRPTGGAMRVALPSQLPVS